jgi:ferrous-iron efflux pump FieF
VETSSVSIFASLVDSLLDISASVINLIAMRLALAPPDHNHRFGHDKIEDLAVFGQAIFFFASGGFILFSAIKSLYAPVEISSPDVGVHVMIISMVLTLILITYQTYVIRKTHSTLIKADKLHYVGDFLANGAVIVSLYLSSTWYFIDAVFGSLIAIYIIHSSYDLFIKAIRNLIDEEFSDEERAKILAVLANFNDVILGVHELKTRHAGRKPFIQLHIEMEPTLNLIEAHKISDKISMAIEVVFKGAEVTIHQDPFGYEQEVNYREKI